LDHSLNSIARAVNEGNSPFVVLVAPSSVDASKYLAERKVSLTIQDNGLGLADAINSGFSAMPSEIEYMNWLGDDDLLTPGSLSSSIDILGQNPEVVMTFGACDYIDSKGNSVWLNQSGGWAVPLLRFGPDLIPQPGALFRRSKFNDVGELRTDLGWAFDFDLFIRLSKAGKLHYINQTLAQFRWHPESLSVEHRKKSVAEASRVRVSHLPAVLRPISFLWEYLVRQATLIAGKRISAKAQSKAKTK
jgi:GT2 family glycosyltransferase